MSVVHGAPAAVLAGTEELLLDLARAALQHAGVEVAGHARSWPALRRLCRSRRPDVAVTDGSFAGARSAAEIEQLARGGARVLVVSGATAPQAERLVLQGVAGYVHVGDTGPEQLGPAALAVARGEVVLPPGLARRIVEQWRHLRSAAGGPAAAPALTAREAQVLAAVAQGLGTKGVARALGISAKTVENHKARIFTKLGVHTQAHAIAEAIARGLLPATAGTDAGGRPA